MGPDFADLLLNESHLDTKQRQVLDDDVLFQTLKLDDNEELQFFFEDGFKQHVRTVETVNLDLPFEITAEDLELFEAQERLLFRDNTPSQALPNHEANKENTLPVRRDLASHQTATDLELLKVKSELTFYRDRTTVLNEEIDAQKRQILTKEGQVTILRQRLVQLENEKLLNAQKYAERTDCAKREVERIEDKWRQETEKLKMEIRLKEQEIRNIASFNRQRKIPKGNAAASINHIESMFGIIKTDDVPTVREGHTSAIISDGEPTGKCADLSVVLSQLDDLDMFCTLVRHLDAEWSFGQMRDFDALDIVKAKEVATTQIRSTILTLGAKHGKSGKALAAGIVALFQHALHLRQETLLSYVSRLLEILFDLCGDRFKNALVELRSDDGRVQYYEQTCRLLTGRVLLYGIPKTIISSHLVIFNVILFQHDMKIPDDLRALASGGFFQWILRSDKLDVNDLRLAMTTLHSLSCDLGSISAIFLSSDTDKIESLSVLDLLQAKAFDLLDSLFPRGKAYRRRGRKQLPLLDDESARLLQADAVFSLLFSFVHRALGPVTLWIPKKLLVGQTVWILDVFEHDVNTTATEDCLSPRVLVAQEELLKTLLSGLDACWHSKDISMAEVLLELRLPLAFVAQQLATTTTSFSGAACTAQSLFRSIEREIDRDLTSLCETGHLASGRTRRPLRE